MWLSQGGNPVPHGAGAETEAGRGGPAGPGEGPELTGADQGERREDERGCDTAEK